MAKRPVFFQLYLNPKNERDQMIITWLEEIPRWHRSQKVKEILVNMIHGNFKQLHSVESGHTSQDAAQVAKKLFSSFIQKPSP